MRRFRWSLLFLLALVVVGAGASSVFAGSHATKATYWNNVITTSIPSGDNPVHSGDHATWTFTSLSGLAGATEVYLNFQATVKSLQESGGSGFATTLKVTVTGVGTSTFTVTLANPWRPHVAFSNATDYGQEAFASLKLPTSLWRYAGSLTVTAQSLSNTVTNFGAKSLVIGYSTVR
jgi:hypothetical protein